MISMQQTSSQMFFPPQHTDVESVKEIFMKISANTLNGFIVLNMPCPRSHRSLISKESKKENGNCWKFTPETQSNIKISDVIGQLLWRLEKNIKEDAIRICQSNSTRDNLQASSYSGLAEGIFSGQGQWNPVCILRGR